MIVGRVRPWPLANVNAWVEDGLGPLAGWALKRHLSVADAWAKCSGLLGNGLDQRTIQAISFDLQLAPPQ